MTTFGLLLLTAFLAPVTAPVAPLGMAPLLALLVVGICGVYAWRHRRLPPVWKGPAAIAAATLAWGALTLAWSLDPSRGGETLAKLAFIFFGGLAVANVSASVGDEVRRRVAAAMLAGFLPALAVLAVDVFFGGVLNDAVRGQFALEPFQPFHLNRPVTICAVFLWPAAMAADRLWGRRASYVLLTAGVAVLAATESTTAAIAVLAGAACLLPLALGRGAAAARRLVGLAVVVATLGGPAYSLGVSLAGEREITSTTFSSIMHRLYIWDFVADRIREKPLAGWGLESSPSMPGGSAPRKALHGATPTEQNIEDYKSQLLPLHPHNAGLQVWLELGLPGIFLFVGLVLWALRAIGRHVGAPFPAALCTAQLVCVFVIADLAYGIWQSWWMSTIMLGVVFSVSLLPAKGNQATGARDPAPTIRR